MQGESSMDGRLGFRFPKRALTYPEVGTGPLLSLFKLFEFMADPFLKCGGAGMRPLLPQR
jgi:hypothetical protein